MCGIIGIVGKSEVAPLLYDGLTVLQHRGQDAAGIATVEGDRLRLHKHGGLVRDVFQTADMLKLRGRIGIGHCRYPTAGSEQASEAQPFYVNSPYGIALGHNGNLVNAESLRREMYEDDRRHINTDSDSEILLNILAHELQIQERHALTPDHIFKAVARRACPRTRRLRDRVACCSATASWRFAIRMAFAHWCSASAIPRRARNMRWLPNRSLSISWAFGVCAILRRAKRCC